jgi:hypothetical protein
MRHLLMRGVAEWAVRVVLVSPVVELTSHSNATCRELPAPALETRRKPFDSFGT